MKLDMSWNNRFGTLVIERTRRVVATHKYTANRPIDPSNDFHLISLCLFCFLDLWLEFYCHCIHNVWLGWRRLMPLHQQSMNAMTDVADAFVCQPPSIPTTLGDCDSDGNVNDIINNSTSSASVDFRYPFGTGVNKKPAYW
jgi:hypothetical protein